MHGAGLIHGDNRAVTRSLTMRPYTADRVTAALLGGTVGAPEEKHPERAVSLGRLGHADIVACKGLAVLERQRRREGLRSRRRSPAA